MTKEGLEKVRRTLAECFVKVLNEATKLDQKAMHELVEHRVECNAALKTHPTIQVLLQVPPGDEEPAESKNVVGVLGLINGLVGVDEKGWGLIAAHFGDDGQLTHFLVRPVPGEAK